MNTINFTPESLSMLLSKTYEQCEFVINNSTNLPLGSHTAGELHKYRCKQFGNRYISKYWAYAGMSSSEEFPTSGIDPYSMISITTEEHLVSIPAGAIFDFTNMLEQNAGLSGSKSHLFMVKNPRRLIATTTITFPTKKEMSRFVANFSKRVVKACDFVAFSLDDGALTGKMRYYGYARLDSLQYDKGEMPNIAFKVNIEKLKHLYDTCCIELYYDDSSEKYSIMVTNCDGVSVGATTAASFDLIKDYFGEDAVTKYFPEAIVDPEIDNDSDTTLDEPIPIDSFLDKPLEESENEVIHRLKEEMDAYPDEDKIMTPEIAEEILNGGKLEFQGNPLSDEPIYAEHETTHASSTQDDNVTLDSSPDCCMCYDGVMPQEYLIDNYRMPNVEDESSHSANFADSRVPLLTTTLEQNTIYIQ